MSKPSAASASKLPQFPQKSAWARGPPNTSSAPTPRSQSPAPTNVTSPVATSHSRRPSTLGQAVAFKDGARSPVSATQSASAVTFGSIDDAAATISSSPASVPPIKTEVPKAFGSVSATPSPISTVNGKQPASSSASVSSTVKPSTHHVTKPAAFNVKSLFMTHSSGPAPSAPSSSQSASDSAASASPSTRPAPLPSYPSSSQPPSHTPQSAQFPSHSFQTFVPGSGLRPQPNGNNTNGPPRSPVYSRPSPNGVAPPVGVNGRPQGPPGTPAAPPTPLSANMPSPRMGHPHAAAPPQMPPGQQPVPWSYYYPYPGMPPEYMYPQGWHVPQHVVPPGQHPHSPGVPQPVPHQPPHQHAQPGIPISPRHPPSNLHPPGTPSVTPAVPSVPIPSPHLHSTPLSSVSSPPSTPASSNGPSAATMDRNAKPFVPGRKVVIKNEQGVEVVLDAFKKQHSSQGSITGFQSPVVPSSPARVPIRMETEEAKNKRLAEEERQRKEKEDAEKAKKEAEEKAKHEEEERIRKEKEEAERLVKEKEEQERKAKEEEERRKKEAEEAEQRKKQEEEERQRKEEEEKRKKEEEEKEKLRKEEAEKTRLKQEEEEKIKKEQESKEAEERAAQDAKVAPPAASVASVEKESKEESKEEGEIDDSEKAAENDEIRDKVSDRPPLRLDTTLDKKRPGPLDLSGTKGPIAPPLPSALASARIIDDINRVEYPEGIRSPKVELNVNAKDGKFKYDRDFLLQFMAICKEKPDSLPPLDAIGLEPSDQNYPITRGGSGRRQNSVSMGPPSSNAPRQALHGLGISAGGKSGFTMGQFSTPSGKTMTSEDRFAMSSRSASMSGTPGMPFGSARPSPMSRSSSQGGPGGVPMGSNRTRSKRGEKRNANTNAPQSSYNASTSLAQALEPVAPLEVSANRWTPASVSKKPAAAANEDSPEVVERKVKGLLNKLTMERFDSISDQIITWANKSEKEKDGRTLIQVIKLVFEKATDEATYSEMYARLCRKMMEQISPKVQDDGIRNSEGKHITGGHLFRKYLLNRCQEDFERGWASKESTAAAAAGKAAEDEAAKTASGGDDEAALYSEEYYAAAKAKRQGLGLIRFIGELFKLQMLTERIMHECVKKLLGNVANPEEEEIESLCKLLTTVGALLDTPKARAHMDVYFSRMKELARGGNVNSRMQFMLLDVIELRERNWIPRNLVAAPTTIAAVHEQAAKEKASVDTSRLSMSRGGSRRGGERGDAQTGPDGWAVAGGSQPRPPAKAGDLSQFGKISKSGPMTFGPSGVFANKEKPKRESTLSRGNMFSMLSQNPELANEVQAPSSKSSRPPSRKPSIDLGSGGAPAPEAAPSVRRKLVLQPRTVPKPEATPAASVAGSDDEGAEGGSQAPAAADSITEEQALKQIDEDIKELLSIRNIDESEEYFKKLPAEHRHHLVEKLVNLGVEAKEDVVDVIAQVFARAVSKDLCSPAHFEEGFLPTAEIIDDVAIDAPKALTFFAKLIKGAGLDKDPERRERIVSKSIDSEKLSNLLTS